MNGSEWLGFFLALLIKLDVLLIKKVSQNRLVRTKERQGRNVSEK